jgi:hypothetical protein
MTAGALVEDAIGASVRVSLLVLLEKLEFGPGMSMGRGYQSSLLRPSRILISIERALEAWAMILKNFIVLENRSLSVLSDINLLRIGSL